MCFARASQGGGEKWGGGAGCREGDRQTGGRRRWGVRREGREGRVRTECDADFARGVGMENIFGVGERRGRCGGSEWFD